MVTRRGRRGGLRRFGRGRRRRVAWSVVDIANIAELPSGLTFTALNPTGTTSAGGLGQPEGMIREGFTCVRLLIDGEVYVSSPENVNSGTLWFAATVVSNREFDNNMVPQPGADDADWMVLGCRTVRQRATIVTGYDPGSYDRVALDLRGRRKMTSPDDRLAFIVRNDNDSIGNVGWRFCVRSLWMLP